MGFEPTNHGFAIRSLRPLGYATEWSGYLRTVLVPRQCSAGRIVNADTDSPAQMVRDRTGRSALRCLAIGRVRFLPKEPLMQRVATFPVLPLVVAVVLAATVGTASPALGTPAALQAGNQAGNQAKPATLPSVDLVGYRLPLLREGSVISRVVGDLTLDPDEKHWIFRPIQPESGNLRREFVLLPSLALEDMLRTRRLAPSPVEFEVTGRVFIYKGRNHLLVELAPPIVRFDTRPSEKPTPAANLETSPNGASKFAPPADAPTRPAIAPDLSTPIDRDGDATVRDIERRLEQRVGRTPLGRASAEDNLSANSGTAPRDAADADRKMLEPGTRLVLRHGRLHRDPQAGSWRFVPEQVTGKGDRSLQILPCLLLERLERLAREGDASPNILLSGTVIVYEGNPYLLPTNFRKAREGRGIGR